MVERNIAERADTLSKRRARMLPFLAVIFLSQQGTYFATPDHSPHSADSHAWTAKPAISSSIASISRMSGSSSTTRIAG